MTQAGGSNPVMVYQNPPPRTGRIFFRVVFYLEPFATQMNPSAERVAEHIASVLAPQIHRPARLVCVRVTEASHCHAIFTP